MGWCEAQLLNQGHQVGRIFIETPLPGWAFSLAVPPSVIGQDPESLGEDWNHLFPVAVIRPASIDQHQRRTRVTGEGVGEADTVDRYG